MRPVKCLIVAAVLTTLSAAVTAQQPGLPSEVRLSDAEKEKVLEAAATRNRQQAAAAAESKGPQIHGEVGFAIGTNGYRSAYGTAIVPLEGEGLAIISLGSTDFGSRGRYLDPWWH